MPAGMVSETEDGDVSKVVVEVLWDALEMRTERKERQQMVYYSSGDKTGGLKFGEKTRE